MFFNSYSNINLEKRNTLIKNILTKVRKNNIFENSIIKRKNYINYTFSDKNINYIKKAKSSKKFKKKSMNLKNNKRLKVAMVNNYIKSLQKTTNNWTNSINNTKEGFTNYKNAKNIIKNRVKENNEYNNKYYNEELLLLDNINKISNNNSIKTNEMFDSIKTTPLKTESNKIFEMYKENSNKSNNKLDFLYKDNYQNNNKFKINSIFKSSLPIFKRINMLKDIKNSIDKIKKNNYNTSSSSSFKTIYYESNQSKFNNYSLEKNKYEIRTYNYKGCYKNDISNKKPVIIKHIPKPKLSVPKFKNINNIEI